jgi:hypothetical protein
MVGRLDGSGFMMTVPFGLAPAGHGAKPASHNTCGNGAPPVFPAVVVRPQAGWVFSRLAGGRPPGRARSRSPSACYHMQMGPCCLNAGMYILMW